MNDAARGSRRQPLVVWLCTAYAAGILLRGWFTVRLDVTAMLAAVCVVLLAVLRSGRRKVWSAIGLFFVAGLAAAGIALAGVQNGYLVSLARDDLRATIRGSVVGDPISKGGTTSFVIRATRVVYPGPRLIDELVKVNLTGPPPGLFLGDKLEVCGRLRLPKTTQSADFRGLLLRQGIGAMMTTYPALVRRLPSRDGAIERVYRFRVEAGRGIDSCMGPDAAAIARGIILGDRSEISNELNDSFKRTGLAHVLAVSGLHVVLLAGVVIGAARLVGLGSRSRQMLVMCTVAVYVVLTGSQPSVLRAALMMFLAVVLWMLGRQRDMMASIAVAGLALLAYRPLFAFDVGFQLSFGAVIALVVIGPKIEPHLRWLPQWMRMGVGAALSAQLGVAPLLAIYFNQVSIIAPVANLAVVGPSGVALAVGLLGCVILPLVPPAGKLAHMSAGLIFAFIVAATEFFGRVRLAAVTLGTPSIGQVVAYYCGLAWWLLRRPAGHKESPDADATGADVPRVKRHRESLDGIGIEPALGPGAGLLDEHRDPRGLRRRRLVRIAVPAFLGAALVGSTVWGFSCVSAPGRGPQLSVVFLDVGQGDATLLHTSGETVLIDGGPSPSVLTRNLADEGVARIDLLCITHEHSDHIAGLPGLGTGVPVGTVAVARGVRLRGELSDVVAMLRRRGARLRRVGEGDRFDFSDGLRLVALYPDRRLIRGSESDANNNSLVLRATYGHFRVLLAGDLQGEAEDEMLREGLDLRADVLKIPHHGSSRGAHLRFLRAVRPTLATISVGETNRFGHPAPSTLARLTKLDILVRRTDDSGDIEVVSDGRTEAIRTER